MLLLGHRGARRCAPENTMAAFECALEHGCHGFEFDVRRTSDGRCVICHDPQLAGRNIETSRYDQLAPPPPCLPDVLQAFSSRAFLDIELKVTGLEAEVVAMLRDRPPERGYLVSSFLPVVIEHLRAQDESVPLGLICDSRRQFTAWTQLPIAAVFLERALVVPGVVEELHTAGKQVFVWTVNREREMRHLAALGVEGIISDDTKLLAQVLSMPAPSAAP